MIATILFSFAAAWSMWSLVTLYQNYQVARKIGLPIVIEPVSSLNLPWLVTNQLLKTTTLTSRLRDLLIRRWMRFSYIGWQFDQGYKVHAELGSAFVLVSPGLTQVVIGDADAAHEILSRRKDFIKPALLYDGLNVFGPNLDTVEGHTWQRHRRLTAPSFSEAVSSSVWSESIRQAHDMLESWTSVRDCRVSTTASDTATVALNVLTACGLGVQTSFAGDNVSSLSKAQNGDEMTYRDAVMTILHHFPFLLILPMRLLNLRFLPKTLHHLGTACTAFKRHVYTMLATQRSLMESNEEYSANLLTNLIHASDAEKSENPSNSIGLTDEEILGNMFIFSLAGHETTANTVATAMFYLARYPEYQSWVRDEIHHVLLSLDEEEVLTSYHMLFPHLKRCLAVMFETLRVHGSIVFIPKSTNQEPQTFRLNDDTHTIPPHTFVYVNNHAIQLDPKHWGPHAEEWNPKRWICGPLHSESRPDFSSTTQIGNDQSGTFDAEELFQPLPGSFIPWADGPRICPGKKFSQVEFVAILAVLLAKHQVSPVIEEGSNLKGTNERLDAMLRDSEISTATLQIRDPMQVRLKWTIIKE